MYYQQEWVRSNSLYWSTRSIVSTRYNQTFVDLVYSCSNTWGTQCSSNRACITSEHIITHFRLRCTSIVMVPIGSTSSLIYFRSVSCKCPGDNPDPVTEWCSRGKHWHPHNGAAWEQPWFPSDLTKIPHGCKLYCFWPRCLCITLNGWLSICILIFIVNTFKLCSQ